MEAVQASTLRRVREWLTAEHRIAAATLVEVEGSALLEPGATMWVDDRGGVEGSVTGGCVEGALVEHARAALEGAPPRTVAFGTSDELSGEVGLTCGGRVQVHVAAVEDHAVAAVDAAFKSALGGRPVVLGTLLDAGAERQMAIFPEHVVGSFGLAVPIETLVRADARRALAREGSGLLRRRLDGAIAGDQPTVLLRVFARGPQMVIVGAIDHSAALAMLAGQLGFEVTICDPRVTFASSPRFSAVAAVTASWPQDLLDGLALGPSDAVVVLSHDPKLDEAALRSALRGGAGYVGALGSRRTQRERITRLRCSGVSASEATRISGPCGLDIGATTPGETAVSILAEIIATRSGRAGGPLVNASGEIRRRRPAIQCAELAAQA